MSIERLPQNSKLFQEHGLWKLGWRDDGVAVSDTENREGLKTYVIGPATGPEQLTEQDALRVACESFPFPTEQDARAAFSDMTVADFVESKFVPEHVAIKRTSGRTHYQAILKHVLKPEEVDRVFRVSTDTSKAKLKANPDWPYISQVRLRDAVPDHVQRLVSAALQSGYSTQTATHIRNVVSAIFSHAIREQYLTGGNPASQVTLPGMKRKETHALTLAQTKEVLEVMQYPEREISLIAILTNMNVAEICGLQWKHVNLKEYSVEREGELIPPRSIAIRKQWYRGELCSVTQGRHKILPIPQLLLPILIRLSHRGRCTGMDDFVLMSNAGTPINQMNVAARRLKSIGRELAMPWLSWQVFRRTHAALVCEFGMQFQQQLAMVVQSESARSTSAKSHAALRLCDPPAPIPKG